MKRELRKLFSDVFCVSLNSDQLNSIAQEVAPDFDLRKESGFGHTIAIPARAAAETFLDYVQTEERAAEFFERMLQYEGKFIYDSTLRIVFKEELLDALFKNRWIFDRDTRTLRLDPFFAENLNFLRGIQMIDLTEPFQQKPARIAAIADEIRARTAEISRYDLSCQVTMRMNRTSGEIPGLIEEIVGLILRRQMMKSVEARVYQCVIGIATEARNRLYRSVLASRNGRNSEAALQEELENSGDTNLSLWAHEAGTHFDLHLKSSEEAISCWSINHFPFSRFEKIELLESIDQTAARFTENPEEEPRTPIARIIKTAMSLGEQKAPLRAIFYPDRVKTGFFLKRELLRRGGKNSLPVLDPALIVTL